MPGYGYAATRGTHRISLEPFNGSDDWVDIVAGRSSAAAARVQSAGMALTGVAADGTPRVSATLDIGAMRLASFREFILAWSLRASPEDEEPMPLSDAAFQQLDAEFGAWLDTQITVYYAQRKLSEERLKNSGRPSTGP